MLYNMNNDKPRGWVTDITHPENRFIHSMWRSMHERCYNMKSKGYKNYGAKGCIVCNDWHTLSIFEEWFKSQPSYPKFLKTLRGWSVDKDSILEGNLCYCPEYCTLMTKSNNSKESVIRNGSPFKNTHNPFKPVIGIKDNKIIVIATSKDFNDTFKASSIRKVVNTTKTYRGFRWFHLKIINL